MLVGINLLREGLDMPEVSLVAILDADKEGFLRSEKSLIQTIGRAARHINGRAILYGDKVTGSMDRAISETNRGRSSSSSKNNEVALDYAEDYSVLTPAALSKQLKLLEEKMHEHAKNLEFEEAAALRDKLTDIKQKAFVA